MCLEYTTISDNNLHFEKILMIRSYQKTFYVQSREIFKKDHSENFYYHVWISNRFFHHSFYFHPLN